MNKVMLITGTSKGIGKELALYYLSLGFIVVGCSRSPSDITNNNYMHFVLDISDENCVVEMVRKVKSKFNRIDVLINNAGIASMNHLLTTSLETTRKIFSVNFFGTFIFTREVSKIMMKQKFGKIVNFTTVASAFRLEGEAIYAASKSAVENFTQTASKELACYGINVNAIGPTPIKTNLIKAVPKDKIQSLLSKQSFKEFASFKDISNVIDFFISDRSSFITGQIIYLGGVCN